MEEKMTKQKIKKTLTSLIMGTALTALAITSGCDNEARPHERSSYTELASVTDMDGDQHPDVIKYRNVSYGGRDAYVFKKGYGPARSYGTDVVISYKDKEEFEKECVPILMRSYSKTQ